MHCGPRHACSDTNAQGRRELEARNSRRLAARAQAEAVWAVRTRQEHQSASARVAVAWWRANTTHTCSMIKLKADMAARHASELANVSDSSRCVVQ